MARGSGSLTPRSSPRPLALQPKRPVRPSTLRRTDLSLRTTSRNGRGTSACAGDARSDVTHMATLKSFFPTLGAKRRLEPQEGTDESLESATDGDGSASSLAEADSECSQDDCVTPQTSNRRKWQASWVKQFPWLEKKVVGSNEDFDVLAVCRWCRDAGKSNAFARGSGNLKASAFIRHETRNPDHTVLVFGRKARDQGCSIDIAISKQCELEAKRAAEGDVALEVQMRTMYSIVKSGQPLSQFNNLCELQALNNTPGFQDPKRLYTSYCSHLDLVKAINITVEEKVDENLHNSPFIGLVIDESTDVAVYKKLVIYARVVINGQPFIHFVHDVNIIDGKAETIVKALEDIFTEKGLEMSKITSLASDGASVMVGRKNGVGARLRSKYVPYLVQVHCIAHRLALAAANACKKVSSFDQFQCTLKQVYRFYTNSPVRYNSLRELQQVLEDDPCLRTITLKEPASFRWLSMYQAVKAVFHVFPALCLQLDNESAEKASPDAKGLLTKLRSIKFVLALAFLLDVLEPITKLSKLFQGDLIDISIVRPAVESTIAVLEDMQSNAGLHLRQVHDATQNGIYTGIKLQDTELLRTSFQKDKREYLGKLISNLQKRFGLDSLSILEHLDKLLNPAHLNVTTSGILESGKESLEEVVDFYGKTNMNGGIEIPSLINPARTKEDFLQFKYFLKSFSSKPLSHVLTILCNQTLFPDFATMAKLLLVSPVASVPCERAFSTQNFIKTRLRSCLSPGVVDSLMRIRLEGPIIKNFDAKRAAMHFCAAKQRRK